MNKRITIAKIIPFALTTLLATNLSGMDDRKRGRDERSGKKNPTPLKRKKFSDHENDAVEALCALRSSSSAPLTLAQTTIPTHSVATQTDKPQLDQPSKSLLSLIGRMIIGGMMKNPQEVQWIAYAAAKSGHIPFLSHLLNHGVPVETKYIHDLTLLHAAAFCGHTDTTRFLIERGAPIEAKTRGGATPLVFAATYGHTDTTRLLIERGASIEATTNDGRTPLVFAATCGRTDTTRLLIERGALAHETRESVATLLKTARENEMDQSLIAELESVDFDS